MCTKPKRTLQAQAQARPTETWRASGLVIGLLVALGAGCGAPRTALRPAAAPRAACAIEVALRLTSNDPVRQPLAAAAAQALRVKAHAEVARYVPRIEDLGAMAVACAVDLQHNGSLQFLALRSPQAALVAQHALQRAGRRAAGLDFVWGQNLIHTNNLSRQRAVEVLTRWQPPVWNAGELVRLQLDGQQVLQTSEPELRRSLDDEMKNAGMSLADLARIPALKPFTSSFDAALKWLHQIDSLVASLGLAGNELELVVQVTPRPGTVVARFAQQHSQRDLRSLGRLPAGAAVVGFSHIKPGAGAELGLTMEMMAPLPWSSGEAEYLQQRARTIESLRTGLTLFALYPHEGAGLVFLEAKRPDELLRAQMERQQLLWRRSLALDNEELGARGQVRSVLLPRQLRQVPTRLLSSIFSPAESDDGKEDATVLHILEPSAGANPRWRFALGPAEPSGHDALPQLTAAAVAGGVLLSGSGEGPAQGSLALRAEAAVPADRAHALGLKDGPFFGLWILPQELPSDRTRRSVFKPLLPLFERLALDSWTPQAGALAADLVVESVPASARLALRRGVSITAWSTGQQLKLRVRAPLEG